MTLMKRTLFTVGSLLLVIFIAACGSSGGGSTSSGSSTSSSQSNNQGSQGAYGSQPSQPTAAPTTASASTGNMVIKTATATVNGKTMTILTTMQGMTLYYFIPDTASKVACTDGCTQTWPPLLFTGSGSPKAATALKGELEIYPNANGKQVIYNDHELYTYGGDTAAGQVNGEGIGNKWFVATPDLAKNKP